MKTEQLDNMIKGWFVGDFKPTAYKTNACEVAVKKYKAGEKESCHYHAIATEITLVLSGSVRMNGVNWNAGDIIILNPGEETDFEALTDTVNVVVKTPSVKNDKFLTEK